MRLINLDNLQLPGKTIMTKLLDKYEREHRMGIIRFPIAEYDAVLYPGKDYFEVRRRGYDNMDGGHTG